MEAERADGKAKSSKGRVDSRESKGLIVLKLSTFHLNKAKPTQKDMVKALLPTPYLPSDFEVGTKDKREVQVEWPGLFRDCLTTQAG